MSILLADEATYRQETPAAGPFAGAIIDRSRTAFTL